MKKVIITLSEEAGSYRVIALVNTCQLSIGQIVDRDRVERWCANPLVTVRINSAVQETEQLDLLSDKPKKQRKIKQDALLQIAQGGKV